MRERERVKGETKAAAAAAIVKIVNEIFTKN